MKCFRIIFLFLLSAPCANAKAVGSSPGIIENTGQISNKQVLFFCNSNSGGICFLKSGISFVAYNSDKAGISALEDTQTMANLSSQRVDLIANEFTGTTELVASTRLYSTNYIFNYLQHLLMPLKH